MAFAWAVAICAAVPGPPTPGTVRTLNSWITCENGPAVTGNNPMNTTEPGFGSTGTKNGTVRIYPDPARGVLATAATLRNGRYPTILAGIHRGNLLGVMRSSNDAQRELATWGTRLSCLLNGIGGAAPGTGSSKAITMPSQAEPEGNIPLPLVGVLGGGGALVVVLGVLGVGGYLVWRRVGG